MRFNMPHHPLDFEIPDAWWEKAGMNNFQRTGSHYRTRELGDKLKLIPLTALEPPIRLTTHTKDWRGFDKARLISVLSGFVGNHQIEPVEVTSLGDAILADTYTNRRYDYAIKNGYHRYYASIAAGYDCLPVI
jgi:hypothetical protein